MAGAPEHPLDVERLVLVERLRSLDLAGQQLLGQGWSVIRAVDLVADDDQLAVEALAPRRLRRPMAGEARSDDHHPPICLLLDPDRADGTVLGRELRLRS